MHKSRTERRLSSPACTAVEFKAGAACMGELPSFTVSQSRVQSVAQVEKAQDGEDDGNCGEKSDPIEAAEKGHLASLDDVAPGNFRRFGSELEVAQGGFDKNGFGHDERE